MINRLARGLSALLCPLLLGACGFTPLYAAHDGKGAVTDGFQSIKIANIPDRDGQLLRNDLLDRLYHNGVPAEPLYILTISAIEERTTEVDILPTADATRAELRMLSYMTLKDVKTGDVLLQRDLLAAASYNILSSQYTTIVSQQNVRANELNDMAQQVETQLALYFARQKKTDQGVGGP